MTSQPKTLSSESWYIASPYSHENDAVVEERVAAAKRVEAFMAENYSVITVYVPIANTTEQQKRGVKPKKGLVSLRFRQAQDSRSARCPHARRMGRLNRGCA